MKFNRKYIGPIPQTKQGEVVCAQLLGDGRLVHFKDKHAEYRPLPLAEAGWVPIIRAYRLVDLCFDYCHSLLMY